MYSLSEAADGVVGSAREDGGVVEGEAEENPGPVAEAGSRGELKKLASRAVTEAGWRPRQGQNDGDEDVGGEGIPEPLV